MGGKCQLCYDVCPGKDVDFPSLNRAVFGKPPGETEQTLGVALDYYRGYATDETVRSSGSSGGVVSALLIYALDKGLVDAATVTGMGELQPWRVVPTIARTRQDVIASAQSRYAVVPANSRLKEAASGSARLAVVGLPCHVHGIRKIQALGRPKRLADSVKLVIGLLCGTNSSRRGTEHMVEELCGVPLEDVAKMEFRGGDYPGRFQATTRDGRVAPLMMTSAAMGYSGFTRERCQICYDYPAELADISVGDFFHPEMKPGVKGWSTMIVRSDIGKSLVENAARVGYLHIEPVETRYLLGAGWELKRHGAVYRIMERQRLQRPAPDYHLELDYPKPFYRVVDQTPPYARG